MLQNLLLGRHAHRRSRFAEELLFLPRVRALELAHREAVEKVIDFLDLQPYRDSFVVNLPYGVRKVVEMGARSAPSRAAAARRALLRPQRRGDRGHGVLDPGHPDLLGITVLMVEHDMSLVERGVRPRAGPELRPRDRHRHAREVQGHPDVVKAYLGG